MLLTALSSRLFCASIVRRVARSEIEPTKQVASMEPTTAASATPIESGDSDGAPIRRKVGSCTNSAAAIAV